MTTARGSVEIAEKLGCRCHIFKGEGHAAYLTREFNDMVYILSLSAHETMPSSKRQDHVLDLCIFKFEDILSHKNSIQVVS